MSIYRENKMDYGPKPYVANIAKEAMKNTNFRTTVWTGCYAQMTLMCISENSDIGLEIHEDTDQLIRIESGTAQVKMGCNKNNLDCCWNVCMGDVVFVPAGVWHNVINTGNQVLKLSAVYTPPHHPAGTIHRTKKDTEY